MRNDPLTRLRVRLLRGGLDEQLAQGADPASTDTLALRADQLLRDRAELAAHLERTAAGARERAVFSARVPLRRAEIIDCHADIEALVERLREAAPTDVRGVAMVSTLLHDGASPLYTGNGQSLRYAVRAARLALDPLGAVVPEVPVAA